MIYTADNSYLVRYNLSDYEEQLKKDGFFKVHRSYLVSLSKVKKLGKGEVFMEGDISVPVSRSAASELKDALYMYLENNAF
jgi:two-component system response regulator LytT